MSSTVSTEPDDAWCRAQAQARARHWRATCRLTVALLAAWFAVGFVVTWFARELDFPFFGWPFSFWVAAQGGAIVFVVLLVVYARRMAGIDRALKSDRGPAAGAAAEGVEVAGVAAPVAASAASAASGGARQGRR